MVKIVIIALVCAVLVMSLKAVNSELYVLALVGSGIILFGFAFQYLAQTVDFLNIVIDATGIDKEFYLIIFKITAIGYLVEFGADTINDLGLKGIAEKLIFAGKIIIFCTSLPIFYAVFNLLVGLVQ